MDGNAVVANNPIYRMIPFALLSMFFLFPLILLFLSSAPGGQWENSAEPGAFLQAKFAYPFSAIVAMDAVFAIFFVSRMSKQGTASNAQGRRIVPFALAEFPVVMGFALSFVNKNAYLVLPFLALSVGLWVYFYTRMEN